ncbi:hypothetical protein FOA43_001468 [Brettanomyces nanus]|uniref:Vacuolar protein-sorting-associated protein 36 n=1 Tax=Eeniella nana TaxID=13502 RepID=A0A875S4G5_EENNA|nr:uncharacterized protein FOA43_001468 [Brettanomyces nanus]QPG74144.1 hypothetical protein FOA43_001468 [Brettanomyces nanus]
MWLIPEETGQTLHQKAEVVDLLAVNGSQCPQCTFINHPSMKTCEMCGVSLVDNCFEGHDDKEGGRLQLKFRCEDGEGNVEKDLIKLSFRNGGEHHFHSKLLQCLQDVQWELIQQSNGANKGAVQLPRSSRGSTASINALMVPSTGIHGLQSSTQQRNYETSMILNDSLQDLDNLLEMGKELIVVGQKYQRVLLGAKRRSMGSIDANLELLHNSQNSMRILDSILNKNELYKARTNTQRVTSLTNMKRSARKKSGKTKSALFQLYIEELARHICEFMVNENILDKNNGLVTLYDLYTAYNEARCVDLVSPDELYRAVQMFDKLKMNFTLSEIPVTYQGSFSVELKEQNMLIVSRNKVSSSSISAKLKTLLSETPNLSVLQIQKLDGFQINYLIIETLLNRLLNDGAIVVDRTLQGEFFYPNEILGIKMNAVTANVIEATSDLTQKMHHVSIADNIYPLFKSNGTEDSSARLQELGDLF